MNAALLPPPPEVDTPPIPQDKAAQQRFRAADLDRLRHSWVGDYERHSKKDPRWDADARRALETTARFFGESQGIGDEQVVICAAARKAIEAGCDDPLIQYLLARMSYGECEMDPEALDRLYAEAVAGMKKSSYPVNRRAFTFHRAGNYKAWRVTSAPDLKPQAERLLDDALALLPEVIKEGKNDPAEWRAPYDLAESLVGSYHQLDGDRRQAFEKVAAVLRRDPANRHLPLTQTGSFLVPYAGDARGSGVALTVRADGWRLFGERLSTAEQALEEAWQLKPSGDIARNMITVEMGQGRGRERMEEWFARALRLDGDDYKACLNKLTYLEPKWHGSEADAVAFGRACLRTENWEGGLPFILVEAHMRLAKYVVPQESYYRRPHVWQDIQAVFGPMLKRRPDSRLDRTLYAKLAYLCGQYAEAHRVFEELGADYWHSHFSNTAEYERMRAEATRLSEAK